MNKSVKINLAGSLFQAEEAAYYKLRDYLRAIEARIGSVQSSGETMEDIERRIAELCQSYAGTAGVITSENVDTIIGIIGSPSDFEGTPHAENHQAAEPAAPRYSYEQRQDRGPGIVSGIFSGIGKAFYVIFRIFAIAFGIMFVLFGFLSLLAFIMILFVKNPVILPFELHGNFFYLPDFLNFIINPALNPWVCILLTIVVILPLAALIFWGIKLIFWFRTRMMVFNLIAFLVWAVSISTLLVLLAGQGLNFSRTGRATSSIIISHPPDTLFIVTGKRISDLKYSSEMVLHNDDYSLYANSELKELSIKTNLEIYSSGDKTGKVEVVRRSAASLQIEADKRAEALPVTCRFSRDTVILDEYFTLPAGHKWSGDEVRTSIYIPANTVIWLDENAKYLLNKNMSMNDTVTWEPSDKYLRMSDNGLIKSTPNPGTR
jgi:hypothetical protein